ncbi:protein GLUTAMINE DUMPER 5-like [Panicum miliaceum]|uniref:Protein GLUTAMINE DUMPER 5-like n=1 Tax=Panicum miliaceum TaxID=4540 RepID=A0A3L6RWP5_PANMI|nr:protein GLUTAMINE DUMPER 5-like [Panicum miliaceum]
MRPGAEFPTMSHGAPTAAPGANATAPHSPWQSPVPYLFGGLAAMLGLIAFALLILACSYWKLSGYLDADRDRRAGEAGADGEKGSAASAARPAAGFLEHVVVIMAGEERPTFLATPAASRAVLELGAVPTAPGSCGSSEEKAQAQAQAQDDGGFEEQTTSQLPVGADDDDGAVRRSHEISTGSSSATALQENLQ